ncbi:hypothetical protein EIP75_23200 [Aquabacterium soli]|jgi:hypothetical protein|uniref:Cell envelope biogenesis protein TolA n=1 Tax=Aquabacterium soli TaxID=2493092 RepID=A0A426UZF0_9BURK|nr:hypothetical protein [Aquabacterium soli]RRR99990.1 hypothetical protein EIP75_23200 [Aquabacterium soli]
MNTQLKTLLAATAAAFSLSAMAVDTNLANDPGGNLTKQEARDLKTQNKAEYKANKKVAEANKDLDVADCKTANLEAKDERDCKHDAKTTAKAAKHDAKEAYKDNKGDIKSRTE